MLLICRVQALLLYDFPLHVSNHCYWIYLINDPIECRTFDKLHDVELRILD